METFYSYLHFGRVKGSECNVFTKPYSSLFRTIYTKSVIRLGVLLKTLYTEERTGNGY